MMSGTFDGIKASDRVLRWLPGMKNVESVEDSLSRVEIDSLENQENK
jgi:hypothetical protein